MMRSARRDTARPGGAVVILLAAVAACVLSLQCLRGPGRTEPGDIYRELARPEIWQLVPHGQAEALGLQPGDLFLSYDGEDVTSNAEVVAAVGRAAGRGGRVPVEILRSGRVLRFEVEPGPIGVLPVALRRPSGLAVALTDIMGSLGLFADYDWLAALTGESFALSADSEACRAWWPSEAGGVYLEDLALMAGLSLRPVFPNGGGNALSAVLEALAGGDVVLVQGGWPYPRGDFWGVATRFDPASGEVGVLYGYTLDSAEEQPLSAAIGEAWVVEPGTDWDDLDEVLALVLTQALELGLTRTEQGLRTGLQAYDLLITGLDTVPFCPACGPEESPVCFDRLIWAMVAHKESAIRFLGAAREVVPEEAALIDEIVGDIRAQIGKLEGIARSGARIGVLEDQRKIARTLAEVQVIENDLLGLYEQLLGSL